jgi:hypothetical protein
VHLSDGNKMLPTAQILQSPKLRAEDRTERRAPPGSAIRWVVWRRSLCANLRSASSFCASSISSSIRAEVIRLSLNYNVTRGFDDVKNKNVQNQYPNLFGACFYILFDGVKHWAHFCQPKSVNGGHTLNKKKYR